MPPKKSHNSISSNKKEKPDIRLIDLSKFCCKKIYEIVFVNETDISVSHILERILKAGSKYDKICRATFLTYEDVKEYVALFLENPDAINLPDDLKNQFKEILEDVRLFYQEDIPVPTALQAVLIKLKLIQTMYNQYDYYVRKLQDSKRLADELNELLTYTPPVVAKKGAKDKKSKESKDTKKDKEKKDVSSKAKDKKSKQLSIKCEDVTKIPLVESDVVGKSNYDDEIWFYIFKGFRNPYIFEALIGIDVPVSIIAEIVPNKTCKLERRREQNMQVELNHFWETLNNLLYGYKRSEKLENTILMKYIPTDENSSASNQCEIIADYDKSGVLILHKICNKNSNYKANQVNKCDVYFTVCHVFKGKIYNIVRDSQKMCNTIVQHLPEGCADIEKTWLEELIDVFWKLSNLKIRHMEYIKNLKLNTLIHFGDRPFEYPRDFKVYDKLLSICPYECLDVSLILDSLVEEVNMKLNGTLSESKMKDLLDLEANNIFRGDSNTVKCACPFAFDYFIPRKKNEAKRVSDQITTYQTHEHNTLEMIRRSYRAIGRMVYDIHIKHLQENYPTILLKYYDQKDYDEYPHSHNKSNDTCTEMTLTNDEIFYYTFLFVVLKLQCQSIPAINNELTDINENLGMNDVLQEYERVKPQEMKESPFEFKKRSHHMKFSGVNLYEIREIASYNWAEILPSSVMLQEIAKCNEQYTCVDYAYCDELDCLLLRYHDNLDKFGVNTKVWHESLRTPVCFRDFCRYICNYDIKWIASFEDKLEEAEENSNLKNANHGEDPKDNELQCAKQLSKTDSNINFLELLKPPPGLVEKEIMLKKAVSKELLTKILGYPKSEAVRDFCINEGANQMYVGYDLGTQHLEVNGSTTVFQSHDGVRLCVDTTHFIGSRKNLSITLTANDYNLIMHRSHDKTDFLLQIITPEDTIIAINRILVEEDTYGDHSQTQQSISTTQHEAVLNANDIISTSKISTSTNQEMSTKSSNSMEQKSILSKDISHRSQQSSHSQQQMNDEIVYEELRKAQFETHFALVPVANSDSESNILTLENFIDAITERNCKRLMEEVLHALLNGVNENWSLYKLSTSVLNNRALIRKLDNKLQIPIFTIAKRILQREAKKMKCKHFMRKYIPQEDHKTLTATYRSDLRLTLLNGLTITLVPSEVSKGFTEVKQAFLPNAHPKEIEHEVYRLFTKNGLILIRYPDGRIDILKLNGEIIQFEKPCNKMQTVSEAKFGVEIGNCFKPPMCKTLYNCQKELQTIMMGKYGDDTANHVSRRAHFKKQKATLQQLKEEQATAFCKLPYCKYSVLKFDGTRVSIDGEKVSQHQETFMTHEFDHRIEERFYKRDDGLKSLFKRDGTMCVQFPDKSRITTWYVIEPELIYVKNKMDGWVSVLLNVKFEHPHYATVTYTGEIDEIEISLKENVSLKHRGDGTIEVNLGTNMTTTVSTENVQFRKGCSSCDTFYTCHIDLAKFTNINTDKGKDVLVANDSYNKIFRVRDADYYLLNKSFIPGPLNTQLCNHYKKMSYEKLYAVKRDYSGLLLWSNNKIENKTEDLQNQDGSNISTNHDIYGHKFIEFSRNIHLPYNQRFINTDLYNNICLTRYRTIDTTMEGVAYLVYREVYEMTNIEKLISMLNEITNFLKETGRASNEPFMKLLTIVKRLLDNVDNSVYLSDIQLSVEKIEIPDERPSCNCLKLKFTHKEKADYWKKQCDKYRHYIRTSFVPIYFMSEHYKPNK